MPKKIKTEQPLPTTPFSFFNPLPQDIKLEILTHLPLSHQLCFASVNKDCARLILHPFIWTANFKRYFLYPKQPSLTNTQTDFKLCYGFYIKLVQRLYVYMKYHYLICQKFNEQGEYDENITDDEPDEDVDSTNFIIVFKSLLMEALQSCGFSVKMFRLTELFHQFLRYHPNVNAHYGYGFTLLHVAAALPDNKTVAYLLNEKGADPTLLNDYHNTPLKTAILFCKLNEADLEDIPLAEQAQETAQHITNLILKYQKTIKTFLTLAPSTAVAQDAHRYACEIDCQAVIKIFEAIVSGPTNSYQDILYPACKT